MAEEKQGADVVTEERKSFSEMAEEEMGKDTETREETPASEETEQEGSSEEDNELQALDEDVGFQALKEEAEQEKGSELTLGELKRFKKLYWEKSEGKRQLQDLQRKLEELEEKELSDNEVLGEVYKRGLLPKKQDEPTAKKEEEERFDVDTFLSNVDPQERENARKWIETFKVISRQENADLRSEIASYKDKFGELNMNEQARALEKDLSETKQYVKDTYNLDWETDVQPDFKRKMKELEGKLPEGISLADAGWTYSTITKQVLAEKGVELAKKSVARETSQLNNKKKKANVESPTSKGAVMSDDSGKSLKELLNEGLKDEGLAQFE